MVVCRLGSSTNDFGYSLHLARMDQPSVLFSPQIKLRHVPPCMEDTPTRDESGFTKCVKMGPLGFDHLKRSQGGIQIGFTAFTLMCMWPCKKGAKTLQSMSMTVIKLRFKIGVGGELVM